MKPGPKPKKANSRSKSSGLIGKEIGKELHAFEAGTAKSGRAGAPVKSRAQAIAIALSKARAKGAKVPKAK